MDATSEDLLQFIYQSPIGLIQTDAEGHVSLMNPLAVQLLMPFAEGANISNVFEVLSTVAPELRNLVSAYEKKRGVIVERRRCPNIGLSGETKTILEITVTKISKTRLVVTVQDVTEIVRTENEAVLRGQMMDSILENIRGQKICVLDRAGKIVSWNASGERLCGYRSDEMVGRAFEDVAEAAPSIGEASTDWTGFLEHVAREGVARLECTQRRKDGTNFWAESVVTLLRDASSHESGFLVVTRDVTADRRREQELLHLASTDPLTGALNRRAFFEEAKRQIEIQRDSAPDFCVAMLDIDHFKRLNDSFGHAMGDEALKALVATCQNVVRANDLICRFGGEEFLLFLSGVNAQNACALSERLRQTISAIELEHDGQPVRFTVSIGVAGSAPGATLAEVIERADSALYAAKRDGRDRVELDRDAA